MLAQVALCFWILWLDVGLCVSLFITHMVKIAEWHKCTLNFISLIIVYDFSIFSILMDFSSTFLHVIRSATICAFWNCVDRLIRL